VPQGDTGGTLALVPQKSVLAVLALAALVSTGCSADGDHQQAEPSVHERIQSEAERAPPLPMSGDERIRQPVTPAGAALMGRAADPVFHGAHREIDANTRSRMEGVSWHPGCPVGIDDLRLVEVDHWGFDGAVHRGGIVVHADYAADVVNVFHRLFDERFPIERMQLIDDFDGSDDASMAANNTSGFNCRTVGDTSRWSEHAFGRAIDVNPVQNPFIDRTGRVHPPASQPYVDRSRDAVGMIHPDGPAVRAFASIGWAWGGDWTSVKDYHHFSATGR
jgi:hypothetical protein